MKMKEKSVEIIYLNFVVHSNDIACRRRGRPGLDHVQYPISNNSTLRLTEYIIMTGVTIKDGATPVVCISPLVFD